MATPLDKLIVRESTEQVDDRNILVALTEDQRISFRLKGMKSGAVSIPIKELYGQLTNSPSSVGKTMQVPKKGVHNLPMESNMEILVQRLRTKNATTPCKLDLISRLDELFAEVLTELKNKS